MVQPGMDAQNEALKLIVLIAAICLLEGRSVPDPVPKYNDDKEFDILYEKPSSTGMVPPQPQPGCYYHENKNEWTDCLNICTCPNGRTNWMTGVRKKNRCNPHGPNIVLACDFSKCLHVPGCGLPALLTYSIGALRTNEARLESNYDRWYHDYNITNEQNAKQIAEAMRLGQEAKDGHTLQITVITISSVAAIIIALIGLFKACKKDSPVKSGYQAAASTTAARNKRCNFCLC